MTHRATDGGNDASGRGKPGGMASRLGWLRLARATAAALALLSACSPALADGPVCADRKSILHGLEQKYAEVPKAMGLSADGGVLEVLVAPSGGWTILITYPNGSTCVVAVGVFWQRLDALKGDPS